MPFSKRDKELIYQWILPFADRQAELFAESARRQAELRASEEEGQRRRSDGRTQDGNGTGTGNGSENGHGNGSGSGSGRGSENGNADVKGTR